jgi:hypothetical protein
MRIFNQIVALSLACSMTVSACVWHCKCLGDARYRAPDCNVYMENCSWSNSCVVDPNGGECGWACRNYGGQWPGEACHPYIFSLRPRCEVGFIRAHLRSPLLTVYIGSSESFVMRRYKSDGVWRSELACAHFRNKHRLVWEDPIAPTRKHIFWRRL